MKGEGQVRRDRQTMENSLCKGLGMKENLALLGRLVSVQEGAGGCRMGSCDPGLALP